ncbi:hypothetical protein [Streptomyces sp. NPDC058861]|uniref:hypothetical protein n=1 Tax=Streptomyces sp. NPDC058861 TaxID=3346653 RepID=UPI0036746E91
MTLLGAVLTAVVLGPITFLFCVDARRAARREKAVQNPTSAPDRPGALVDEGDES